MTDKADVTFIKEFDIQTKIIKDMLLDLNTAINYMFRYIFDDHTLDSFINLLYGTIYDTEDIIYRIQND